MSRRAHGQFRQSQVITTYGPGALIDLPRHSAIVGGLDTWPSPDKLDEVVEPRLTGKLQAMTGVPAPRLYAPPPRPNEPWAPARGIGAWRFPEWFVVQEAAGGGECARSGRDRSGRARSGRRGRDLPLRPADESGAGGGERERSRLRDAAAGEAGESGVRGVRGATGEGGGTGDRRPERDLSRRLVHRKALDEKGRFEGRPVVPTRFVRACPRGHVDDLDWAGFVHGAGHDCRRHLWLDERGTTGDLADLVVRCECGKWRRLYEAAELDQIPLGTCRGARPWLGRNTNEENEDCNQPSRLLIRTASNAYFPQLVSVLSLPDREPRSSDCRIRYELPDKRSHLLPPVTAPPAASHSAGVVSDEDSTPSRNSAIRAVTARRLFGMQPMSGAGDGGDGRGGEEGADPRLVVRRHVVRPRTAQKEGRAFIRRARGYRREAGEVRQGVRDRFEVDAPAQAGAVGDEILEQEPAQCGVGDRWGEGGVRAGARSEGFGRQSP